jgi:glycerophosphoryl diester phosphodiesterase
MFGAGSGIRVIGHRGAGGVAPENTIAGIERAVRAGCHAIEIDVHASADERLVVIHDPTVDRTTGGTGGVEEKTLEELRRLDAGYRFTPDLGRSFPFRGRGVGIPTLDEAVAAARDLPLVIEVKSARAGVLLADWLRERRAGKGDAGRFIVGGFERRIVEPAAVAADWRCATRADLVPFVLLGKLGLRGPIPEEVDAIMIPIRKGPLRLATRGFVRRAHARGLGVFVWTVDRPSVMRRLFDLEVDGLISNVPARVRRILAERAAHGS